MVHFCTEINTLSCNNSTRQQPETVREPEAAPVSEPVLPSSTSASSIDESLTIAKSSKTEHKTNNLLPVSNTEVEQVNEKVGIDIAGYMHSIDTSGIRHALKKHGDVASEKNRGQIAIPDEDFKSLPQTLENIDSIILGLKNKQGKHQVISVKNLDDGTVLIIEETGQAKTR